MVAVQTDLHIAGHEHPVNLIDGETVPPSVHIHKHYLVRGGWFNVHVFVYQIGLGGIPYFS